MNYTITVVGPESAQCDKERVYKLRYEVYKKELGFKVGDDSNKVYSDKYDAYSTSLLLTYNGVDIATVRFTVGKNGKLEIEDTNRDWKEKITSISPSRRTFVDITRFMVLKEYRKTSASCIIIWELYKHLRSIGVEKCYVASKVGPLSKLYKLWNSKILSDDKVPYYVDNFLLGNYSLVTFNLGKKGSWESFSYYVKFGFILFLGKYAQPIYKAIRKSTKIKSFKLQS